MPPFSPTPLQLVLRMLELQLCMVTWDRPGAEAVIAAVGAALQQDGSAQQQHDTPVMQQLKLHFNILQVS